MAATTAFSSAFADGTMGIRRSWWRSKSAWPARVTGHESRGPTADHALRYLDLAEELGRLFGLRVDLITEKSVENPYLRQSIDATRQPVYES